MDEIEQLRAEVLELKREKFAASSRYFVTVSDNRHCIKHEFIADYDEVRKTYKLLAAVSDDSAFIRDFHEAVGFDHEYTLPLPHGYVRFDRLLPFSEFVELFRKA